jgi:hypothetical protein
MLQSPRLATLLIIALLCGGPAARTTSAAPNADSRSLSGTPSAMPGARQDNDGETIDDHRWPSLPDATEQLTVTTGGPGAGTVTSETLYALTITVEGSGTVTDTSGVFNCTGTGDGCGYLLPAGAVITLTATPNAGWRFARWAGDDDCSDSATTCVVTMTADRMVTATFEPSAYTLTVSRDGSAADIGRITSAPAGIDCGVTCAADFAPTTVVTLTATPGNNSTFIRWLGACAGSPATCVVTMSQARSAIAVFTYHRYGLTIEKRGSGGGTVASSDDSINCGTTCDTVFYYGTVVTLTAVPDPGSYFAGWSVSGCPQGDQMATTCTYTMTRAYYVVATFSPIAPILTVINAGFGSGTITSSPEGIACGITCTATFAKDAMVTLTATPAPGSSFEGWSGACSGSALTCTVTMDKGRDVRGFFMKTYYLLDLTVEGSGTVTDTLDIFNCTGSGEGCGDSLPEGFAITLTATPAAGWYFAGWSGDTTCDDSAPTCAVTMTADRGITATFTDEPPQADTKVFLPLLQH